MPNQPLFNPYRMGDLDLPNRIVMAPLTRMRAHPPRSCAHRPAGGVLRTACFGRTRHCRGHRN